MDHSAYRSLLPKLRLLRADTRTALGIAGRAAALSIVGLMLSLQGGLVAWAAGQLLLSTGIFLWFVMLHETGHETLFRSTRVNRAVGHVASLFCGIPFFCWQHIHRQHHRWTGWKDRDPTTETALPRPLSRLERWAMDTAWRFWIPLFCPVYVLHNFWNLPRLFRLFPDQQARRRFMFSTGLIVVFWSSLLIVTPWASLVQAYALAFCLVLMVSDPLMLSQHAHIHQHIAGEQSASPFPYAAQDVFTRSLSFPPLVSRYVFAGFDRHEAHHLFPSVPGYRLNELSLSTPNDISWWQWIRRAKRVPGHELVFLTREQSGVWL